MRWFKHFTDNHRGQSIQYLMDELGHAGLSYFLLVEMCAEKINVERGKILTEADCWCHFHPRLVRQNLRLTATNVRRLLDACATMGLLSFEISETSLQIKMPILLNLLDSDMKNPRVKRAPPARRTRLEENRIEENRIEYVSTDQNIDQCQRPFSGFDFFDSIKRIPDKLVAAWREQYPDEWLIAELGKAKIWCMSNPRKTPKNPTPFLTNWFSRGWEDHRKKIASNKSGLDYAALLGEK